MKQTNKGIINENYMFLYSSLQDEVLRIMNTNWYCVIASSSLISLGYDYELDVTDSINDNVKIIIKDKAENKVSKINCSIIDFPVKFYLEVLKLNK